MTEQANSVVDEFDRMLEAGGADFGYPEKRRARAVRLQAEGMTVEDLQQLLEWGQRTRKRLHTVGHFLQWATRNRQQWADILKQIRAMQADRQRFVEAPAAAAPKAAADPETERIRTRALAYIRVHVEGYSRNEAAHELGLTLDELDVLIEAERARRPPPLPAKAKQPEPERLTPDQIKARLAEMRAKLVNTQRNDESEIW